MDITDHPDLSPAGLTVTLSPLPAAPRHIEFVKSLISKIDPSHLKKYNDMLSAFHTRYYTTDTGLEAAQLIHKTMRDIVSSTQRSDIEVGFFQHSWKQPSVFARIKGRGDLAKEIVILSSHEDSINGGGFLRAPGADDNASGTATVLEIFRILAVSGYKPARTIEFHTYAAEEVGLRGSQDVAASYQRAGALVHAQMQLDMTMFLRDSKTLVLMTDYVDAELTDFNRKLVTAYTNRVPANSRCGYGCSDHASWTKAGYRASFPFEAEFSGINPDIHTARDVFENLSLEQGM